MTKDNFDKLLEWLDEDRETAAEKYSSVHKRLVTFFLGRKMSGANEFADEVIDRVSRKVDELVENYEGNPMHYFYKVARNIAFEQSRSEKELPLETDILMPEPATEEFDEHYHKCLNRCLKVMPTENRKALIKYVREEKLSKKSQRELQMSLGVNLEVLRVRIFRIKKSLRKCLETCLKMKKV
jgi:RNA polymerase sigma factor (sigma-70 family)